MKSILALCLIAASLLFATGVADLDDVWHEPDNKNDEIWHENKHGNGLAKFPGLKVRIA